LGFLVNDVMIGVSFAILMTYRQSNEPISWLKVLLDSRLEYGCLEPLVEILAFLAEMIG